METESSLHTLFRTHEAQDSEQDDRYKYNARMVCLDLVYNNRPDREEKLSSEQECTHNLRSVFERTKSFDSETTWSFMITQQLRPILPKQQQPVLDLEQSAVAQTCLLLEGNQSHPVVCPLGWTDSEPA